MKPIGNVGSVKGSVADVMHLSKINIYTSLIGSISCAGGRLGGAAAAERLPAAHPGAADGAGRPSGAGGDLPCDAWHLGHGPWELGPHIQVRLCCQCY